MNKNIKLQINGIHCPSCKSLIETVVSDLEGVANITVDAGNGQARLEFDDQKISKKSIVAEIEKLNYKVEEAEYTF